LLLLVPLQIQQFEQSEHKFHILENEFDIKHSSEYISSLWRKKIPNLIASAAEDDFLD
jgi:hypothetical protein